MSQFKDNISSFKKWYLIYTKPKQERVAEENLNRQHYPTYLPFIQVERRVKGHYQVITEPLFPRYLFIALDAEGDNWGPIRSTRGVSRLVYFGEVAAEVPESFIDFLRQQQDQVVTHETDFIVGDSVQILDGAMAGYQGVFAAKSGNKRVTLLLDIIGKATRVEVPLDMVRKV